MFLLFLQVIVSPADYTPSINRIEVVGNTLFNDEEILEILDIHSFTKEDIESGIGRLLLKYESAGHPFVSIRPSRFHLEDSSISFVINIDEGVRFFVEEIKVEGNISTREDVIRREFRVRSEIYNPSYIERAKTRIDRLGFLRVISITPVSYEIGSGRGFLLVRIKEEPSSSVEGVLGYGKRRLSGFLDVNVQNLFGTGRSFSGLYSSYPDNQTRIQVSYKEPWLFGYPLDLVLLGDNEVFDTLYIVTKANSSILFSPLYELTLKIGMEWNRVIPGTSEWYGIAGVQYRGDDVDISLSTRYGSRGINRVEGRLERLFKTVKNQNLFFSLSGEINLLDTIPVYDLVRIGGANRVRGYDEGEIIGKIGLWSNIEYRFRFGEIILFPFLDLGYAESNDGIFILGKGIGTSFPTPIGRWNIDYGLGRGDRVLDGKLHIRLSTRL